jgi:hypothetical protein
MVFEHSVEIKMNCDVETAFKWLLDLSNLPKYCKDYTPEKVKKVKEGDANGVGAEWFLLSAQLKDVDDADLEESEKKLKKEVAQTCTIKSVTPSSEFSQVSDVVGVTTATETFHFVKNADGTTTVTIKITATFKGLYKLGSPFIKHILRKYYIEMKESIEKITF